MKRVSVVLCVVLSISVVAGGAIFGAAHLKAHEDATGIVKERMDNMKSFGKAVGAMSDMIKGTIAYDGLAVRQGAKTIRSHSGDELIALFPEGSMDEHSEALPTIWQDWTRFSDLAAKLQTRAGALEAAADSQAAFMPAFIDLTDTCTACHTKFRQKQED